MNSKRIRAMVLGVVVGMLVSSICWAGVAQQEHDVYYARFYNATPVTSRGTRLNPTFSLHFRFLVGLPDDATPFQVAEAYAKPPVRASLPSGLPRARMYRGSQYSDGQ